MTSSDAGQRGFTTRELTLLAALGAVFGVLFRGFGPIHELYSAALGKVFGEWDYGIWFIPGLLGGLLLQRPGAALAAELAAGALSLLLGSPWGFAVLLSAAVQGGACESVYAIGRWKRFGPIWMMSAGAAAGICAFALDYKLYDYSRYLLVIRAGRLSVMMVSGALLGGLGARAFARTLAKTGAIDETPLGRQLRDV